MSNFEKLLDDLLEEGSPGVRREYSCGQCRKPSGTTSELRGCLENNFSGLLYK
jgi:hypothetical protein